jgi:AcrR family transcriptional regulator
VTEPSPNVQTRWERRRERTHGRLLHAAEQLFRTRGFDATTVEEIAAAADVAKGTFFNYFSSKETLLGELLYLRIQPLLGAQPAEGIGATDRIWLLLVCIRLELRPYVHLFQRMAMYALTNPLPELPPGGRLSLAQAVARVVRDGQGEGTFRPDCDAEIVGALIATYFFRLSALECLGALGEGVRWEDGMREALNILYKGLYPVSEAQSMVSAPPPGAQAG